MPSSSSSTIVTGGQGRTVLITSIPVKFFLLSNIFDWSDDESVRDHFQYLSKLKQGSAVIIRQLNNHKEWINVFGENFTEDKEFDRYWQIYDRSLFYDHIRLFKRK